MQYNGNQCGDRGKRRGTRKGIQKREGERKRSGTGRAERGNGWEWIRGGKGKEGKGGREKVGMGTLKNQTKTMSIRGIIPGWKPGEYFMRDGLGNVLRLGTGKKRLC